MAMDRYILDDLGEPVPCPDIFEWGRWFEDIGNRRVAWDQVGDYRVSTVFLAVDHSLENGPPVLWETMVFGEGPWDDWQERYTSRQLAEEGHRRVVEAIRRGELPPDA